MIKKILILCILLLPFFSFSALPVEAIVNPLDVPNNKVGVHILFPAEINAAARLVNSNGGDWGYVTIPIQSHDKDIEKWQKFFDDARQFHLIPIIRLATEGDYFNTKVWRKPNDDDIVDFANFLNSLSWPTQNRYIVVFNEPNRADEWGGTVDPQDYASLLSFAVSIFKSKNQDFFIISAGLDNAATNTGNSMDEYTFLRKMDQGVPGIFNQIDGLGSHSYANPGFSQPPLITTKENVTSFRYEEALAQSLSGKKLPVFITETGWVRGPLSDTTIATYMTQAFTQVWNDTNIIAVTPFLLQANTPPFDSFSLLTPAGTDTNVAKALENLPKIKGQPLLTTIVLAAQSAVQPLPVEKFVYKPEKRQYDNFFLASVKFLAKYFLHIQS